MRLELLDSLSLPGDPSKPNDDAFAHRERAAVVMDGATGLSEPLMPGASDAAWLARFGVNRVMAHCEQMNARDAVAAALRDAENSFAHLRRRAPSETYEIPFASMMLAALAEGGLDAVWFGDCAALIARPGEAVELVGDAVKKRARERDRVAALAKMTGQSAAASGVRSIFLPALRTARNMINTEKGGWLFGPDARAAGHAASARVPISPDTHILLVSDGFLALVSDYERYAAASLMRSACDDGLAALGKELREIEEGDPEGVQYPRFKKSDDATAVLLKVV